MALFLERIDSIPALYSDFDMQILQWLWVLVDTLNTDLDLLQNSFNLLQAPSYSAADIALLNGSGALVNGVVLYDTTNNVYVGKQNGSLVKFTTSSYP